jgi:hypothetical protein
MTKEEILDIEIDKVGDPSDNLSLVTIKDALAAMCEYADQFTLDFNKFLEEETEVIREEKITLYRYCDSNNEYGNYTLEDILTEFKEKYYL